MKTLFVLMFALIVGATNIALSIAISRDTEFGWREFASSMFSAIGGETIGAIAVFLLVGWFFRKLDNANSAAQRKEEIRARFLSLLRINNIDSVTEAVNLAKSTGILYDGTLRGCSLDNISLREQRLDGADFQGCIFENSDLSKALLSAANLRQTKMAGAKLNSAVLFGADLYRSDISNEQMASCLIVDQALLPEGMVHEETKVTET